FGIVHRPKMATGARTAAVRPDRLDRFDRVGGNICLDRDSGDADVAADVDPDKLARACHPVDVPGVDAEPFGYLGNGKKLSGLIRHRAPSRSGWTVVDWVNAQAARWALM